MFWGAFSLGAPQRLIRAACRSHRLRHTTARFCLTWDTAESQWGRTGRGAAGPLAVINAGAPAVGIVDRLECHWPHRCRTAGSQATAAYRRYNAPPKRQPSRARQHMSPTPPTPHIGHPFRMQPITGGAGANSSLASDLLSFFFSFPAGDRLLWLWMGRRRLRRWQFVTHSREWLSKRKPPCGVRAVTPDPPLHPRPLDEKIFDETMTRPTEPTTRRHEIPVHRQRSQKPLLFFQTPLTADFYRLL